eukprot:TRINITY_DN24894_c0_g2_i2.p1 TRINITY_DN24894_c0_g2~~TRINITY_DN24894_c0_g2_i2.p1  ORF type:complete len:689 (+),score=73.68 TRINITY_DN24894_c0_g2_i2:103-2169(+)
MRLQPLAAALFITLACGTRLADECEGPLLSSAASLDESTASFEDSDVAKRRCCVCPALDCQAINNQSVRLADALEVVVPGSWFLFEATLIGALRYGAVCHTLGSARKNLVGSSLAVAIVVQKSDKQTILRDLSEQLADWTKPTPLVVNSSLFIMESPARIPDQSCAIGNYSTRTPFRAEFHFLFGDGDLLQPEAGYEWKWQNVVTNDSHVPASRIFPLQGVKLGSGRAFAPKDYIFILTNKPKDPWSWWKCEKLWRPVDKQLASGGLFRCPCELQREDLLEIQDSIVKLDESGYASLVSCLAANASKQAVVSTVTTTTTFAMPEQDMQCCTCPEVDCAEFNRQAQVMTAALEAVVPKSWFFIEGTLIGSLRYGELCRVLKSGKKNLVDSDLDVAVVAKRSEKKSIAMAVADKMPGWNLSMEGDDADLFVIRNFNVRVPEAACVRNSSSVFSTDPLKVDLHFLWEDTSDRLIPDDNYDAIWENFLDNTTAISRDLIFPLQPARLGTASPSYAPHQYIRVLTGWTDNEYGFCDTLWSPRESGLATGDLFDCHCALGESDFDEIKAEILALQSHGQASLASCLPKHSTPLMAKSKAAEAAGWHNGAVGSVSTTSGPSARRVSFDNSTVSADATSANFSEDENCNSSGRMELTRSSVPKLVTAFMIVCYLVAGLLQGCELFDFCFRSDDQCP